VSYQRWAHDPGIRADGRLMALAGTVTCADPRLTDIEQMLGLAHADVDMIRNFGTVIDDDGVRSLVLSTRLLGTREMMIINHTDCGMLRFVDSELEDRLRKETGSVPIAPARSSTYSTSARTSTRGWSRASCFACIQWVATMRPSSSPAAARTNAPVHSAAASCAVRRSAVRAGSWRLSKALADGTTTVPTSVSSAYPHAATPGSQGDGDPSGVAAMSSYHCAAGQRSERSTPKTPAAIAVS
jgi:hypothetical protein